MKIILSTAIAWLLGVAVAIAAPISTYPPATTPLTGAEQMISTQGANTVNVTPSMISSYAGGAVTTTGPYASEVAQPLPPGGTPPFLNIFRYLTPAQQADVQAGTSALDFGPILKQAESAVSAPLSANLHAGAEIYLPPGKYNFSSTYDIQHTIILRGAGGGGGLAGSPAATQLVFPANTSGIVVDQYGGTLCAASSSTTTGAGTVISDLAIVGGGTSTSAHGIHLCARAVLHNVNLFSFPGHQLWVDGVNGNANEVSVSNLNCTSNTSDWCIYEAGPDANGGTYTSVGVLSSGGGGICACGFLGSAYYGVHIDSAGALGLGRVHYTDGHNYDLINRTAGIGASTTPGTNAGVWYDMGVGSGAPNWSNTGTYQVSSGIFSDGVVANNTFYNPYIEPGYPISNVQKPAMVIQPENGGLTTTSPTMSVAFGLGGFFYSPIGFGGYGFLPSGDARGTYSYSYVGPLGLTVNTQAGIGGRLGPYRNSVASGDVCWDFSAFAYAGCWSGALTTQTFGRTAAVPYTTFASRQIIGDGSTNPADGNGRMIWNATSIPSTTGNAVGEIVFNRTPAQGAPMCWMETAQGSPDTWAPCPSVPVTPAAYGSLPTCNSTSKYATSYATDASAATYSVGAAPTGGGSNVIKVYCNGTAWVAG